MRYNIILIDPPWTFKTYSDKGKEKKSPETHYKCMTIEDIYNLPLQNIAADNCALFCWVTNPMLKEGLQAIESWGFVYKTVAFNWFKANKKSNSFFWGLGYHTRQNTEMCLLATKGKPSRISKRVHQIIGDFPEGFHDDGSYQTDFFDTEQLLTRIEEHSKKPLVVKNKIVELFGDLPRIELFARKFYDDGWDYAGNEIDGKDIREFLLENS